MKKGIIAGNFDIIHPGYIALFKECKANCDEFIVLLHSDPSFERQLKMKPILSTEERREMLLCFEQIDKVYPYDTEFALYELIKEVAPNVRFLGDDYKDKPFTGDDLKVPIHYISRDHGWSTTKFKLAIASQILKQMPAMINDSLK